MPSIALGLATPAEWRRRQSRHLTLVEWALLATDETVAAYLAALADHGAKVATIARRLVVIS